MYASNHTRLIDVSTALESLDVVIVRNKRKNALQNHYAKQHHYGQHYKLDRLTSKACGLGFA
eukprot:1265071-Pyramimonas_sp.AAC.1